MEIQDKLTQREYGILQMLAKGYTNKRIAKTLHISQNTVATYVLSIYQKLEIPTDEENYCKRVLAINQYNQWGDNAL